MATCIACATKISSGKLSERRLEDALGYENDNLVNKLGRQFNLPLEQAESLFLACKQFLIVTIENGDTVPNPMIDKAWHEFIVRTKDYKRYCLSYLGKFIHHCPTDGKVDPAVSRRKFVATRELAKARFGCALSEFWEDKAVPSKTDLKGSKSTSIAGGVDCASE